MSDVSAVTKYFATANEGFITTLGTTISAGASVVPLNSVTGLTNGSVFVGIIEPGATNQQVFTGTVDTTGLQVTGAHWTRGANVPHTAGVTIVDYTTGTAFNMITTGFLKEHKQTGAHSNITADTITVATGTTLPAGDIGAADLAAGAVTPEKLFAGAGTSWVWQSWTPTLSNMAVGTGGGAAVTARYIQVGKTVFFRIFLALGTSGQSMGTDPQFTLPVAARELLFYGSSSHPIGNGWIEDNGFTNYQATINLSGTTAAKFFCFGTDHTYLQTLGITASSPMNWSSGDTFNGWGIYEAL